VLSPEEATLSASLSPWLRSRGLTSD
jgi:hypothetical protein